MPKLRFTSNLQTDRVRFLHKTMWFAAVIVAVWVGFVWFNMKANPVTVLFTPEGETEAHASFWGTIVIATAVLSVLCAGWRIRVRGPRPASYVFNRTR